MYYEIEIDKFNNVINGETFKYKMINLFRDLRDKSWVSNEYCIDVEKKLRKHYISTRRNEIYDLPTINTGLYSENLIASFFVDKNVDICLEHSMPRTYMANLLIEMAEEDKFKNVDDLINFLIEKEAFFVTNTTKDENMKLVPFQKIGVFKNQYDSYSKIGLADKMHYLDGSMYRMNRPNGSIRESANDFSTKDQKTLKDISLYKFGKDRIQEMVNNYYNG